MKPKFDKINVFSMVFILCLMAIPGVYAYYFTDWCNPGFFQDAGLRKVIPEFQEDSKIFNKRIVLRKDKGITTYKSRLVYKGFKDKMIHLDVFLLDLDPTFAYPYHISTADARKGIRVGDSTFCLLKVDKKYLQLKMIHFHKS